MPSAKTWKYYPNKPEIQGKIVHKPSCFKGKNSQKKNDIKEGNWKQGAKAVNISETKALRKK